MEDTPKSREGGVDGAAQQKADQLLYRDTISFDELVMRMRHIEARGIFDKDGQPIKPYQDAEFSLVTVYPPSSTAIAESPVVEIAGDRERLWTPQPTIYEDQLFIMNVLDRFLLTLENGASNDGDIASELVGLCGLSRAVGYEWPGRGQYHVMPPVIEQHSYQLNRGAIDLDYMRDSFDGCYVQDAKETLHHLNSHDLKDFYIDHQSFEEHLPIFNQTMKLLDYGRQRSGEWKFNVICDGSHRISYAVEETGRPINAILVQPPEGRVLTPYYAVPRPFHPATRLSSKRAERMFNHIENDKIHLLNEIIKKVGHYDWSQSGLQVSSLRSREQD